jgi:hypothetical protein
VLLEGEGADFFASIARVAQGVGDDQRVLQGAI